MRRLPLKSGTRALLRGRDGEAYLRALIRRTITPGRNGLGLGMARDAAHPGERRAALRRGAGTDFVSNCYVAVKGAAAGRAGELFAGAAVEGASNGATPNTAATRFRVSSPNTARRIGCAGSAPAVGN